jgi:TetR/AcrR family transcriptional repressor of nem operon
MLISEGLRQMLAHGYEGIGIGPVLSAMNVPKGSFYYFFKSKDDFVLSILDAYEARYRTMREALLADPRLTSLQRLDHYFKVIEDELLDHHPSGGCLYGVLAQTVTARDAAIRARLARSYETWHAAIVEILESARKDGEIDAASDTAELATDIIDAYEGTLIRMKATDDPAAFRRFRTRTIPRLLGLATAQPSIAS